MSFRTRLTLFFVLIVIVPMLSVAVVVFELISDNQTGKADAKLAEGEAAARGLYTEYVDDAAAAMDRVGGDPELSRALRTADAALLRRRLAVLARQGGFDRLAVTVNGRPVADVGTAAAIAAARRDLIADGQRSVGRLWGSTTTATKYAQRVERLTSLDVVVRRGPRSLASTGPGFPDDELPEIGTLETKSATYRVASFSAPDFGAGRLRIGVVSDSEAVAHDVTSSRLLAATVLIGFLILAFAFGLAVSRSLHAQIGRFLEAARRIGAGDFSTEVPTEGRDEFAELGDQFNRMSRQLAAQLEELRQERQRQAASIRRIGDTFASNLDRDALLGIVVRTAVDGMGAACGRASVRDGGGGDLQEQASAGEIAAFDDILRRAERDALSRSEPAEVTVDGASALALPLRRSGAAERVLGVLSVARAERRFNTGERDLFNFLAGRAAVSIENVDLVELARAQAVTDELTSLFNHRRFQEVLAREVERARRFEGELGLLMLDIDDFKRINDTFGHQQGDVVLEEVARSLRDSCRQIDEPARYGGEELAVALPQTDLEGAFRLAERIREAIAALEIPRLDGNGTLRMTASVGVAAIPESASDKSGLVAAADTALYEAKRKGKNRTMRATRDRTRPLPGGYA